MILSFYKSFTTVADIILLLYDADKTMRSAFQQDMTRLAMEALYKALILIKELQTEYYTLK